MQWCTKVSAYVVVFSVVRISSLLNRGGQLFEREVARFPIDPAPTNRTSTFWCAHHSLPIQPCPAGAASVLLLHSLVLPGAVSERTKTVRPSNTACGPKPKADPALPLGRFVLYLCHTIGSSSQGAFLALVFMWNESVWPLYRARWRARNERRVGGDGQPYSTQATLYYSATS